MIEETRKHASVIQIDARHNSSRAQGFEQTISGTRDKQNQSLPGSVLQHGSFNQGARLLAGRAKDADSGDPTNGKHENTSTSGFNSADALRGTTRLGPAVDPTSRSGDVKDDGIRPGKASFKDLTDRLGHAVTDPSQGKSTGKDSGHRPEKPDRPPQDDQGDHHDTGHGRLGSMLEHDTVGWISDKGRTDSNGDRHVTTVQSSDQGIVIVSDVVQGKNGFHKGDWTTVYDRNSHTVTTIRKDGSTKTTDTETGKVTTTDPISMPDPDHQNTVSSSWNDLLRNDVKQMHQPSHDGDTVNVVDGIPGMVERTATTGALVDEKARLLGGDQGHDGLQDGGGTGVNGTTPGHLSGVTDPGPDSDQAVHGSGQDERSHETFKHETPGDAASAPKGNDTEASATAEAGLKARARMPIGWL